MSEQPFLAVLGAALLAQGALSLLLDATDLASNDVPQRFANADPAHAVIHVVWGVVIVVLVRRGLPDAAAARLALVFGVFYTALGIAGVVVHHPLGLRLDRGENAFHLIVGPAALAVGLVSGARVRAPAA
jgi:hypothetical protein